MKNLFIIGNGFDLAHKLPTRYSDFKNYLTKKFPSADTKYVYVPESTIDQDGNEVYNKTEVVSFLLKIISEIEGNEWNNLETTLGMIEYDDYFSLFELRDDNKEYHTVYNNEDTAKNILGAVYMIKEFFSDWIKEVDITDAQPYIKMKNLFDNYNALFINFNYTETLEKIYGIKDVCHIHGTQGSDIIFGHGSTSNFDYYEQNFTGAEEYMEELQNSLKKDTKQAIEKHKYFFDKLSEVERIYSYGFSFSDVDLVYIEEICKRINTKKVIWHLNSYDDKRNSEFKKKIKKCGFSGCFDSYIV
ncbi:bacteriophage abortive infection AbiH family protein [Gemella morbillorum]|uniref:bacteriophage abortive infection AbiH family protein n=1 Tax=Gemella morbillorum TaxID=29391 RepID=UPI0023F13373|nr:bacteriophage abortive infection AbiH family protein [Gemella morbillorum]